MYKGKLKSALEFGNNDDSSVQESNIFNEKNLSVSKCVDLLNKIIFLLNQGEDFPDADKSKIFFNVTKLFQVNTPGTQSLRRLMYVFIKELRANENEVFIVISQLTKDVGQNDNEMYKANALRVLTKIIDELFCIVLNKQKVLKQFILELHKLNMLRYCFTFLLILIQFKLYVQSLEKYLKQALIDKSNHVTSAALVSMVNLYKKGGHSSTEIVKKSVNEIQDKLLNSGDALVILFELKKNDQMAILKLLFQLTQVKIHNSMTKCQLIRYIKYSFLLNPLIDQKTVNTFLKYIEGCLTKEEDAVQFEAAKTMCELYEVFGAAVNVELPFQVLVSLASNQSKPVNKYAALRVMNRIATKQPNLVALCQSELENLITDMNRSVASLAISTLLKTCNEDSVQKLLKQISHYLPDLGLDFKIETIQSTALLYHRLPHKADVLLKFLTDCLKEENNVLFRESVVDTIIEICPSQREAALMILAEHIEDCEHAHIQTKIINFLAEEGPKAKNPSSYIRFIYNRVNLEKAVIRAAAVSALATFAHKVPNLIINVFYLISERCLTDSDDEVRERAFFYINLLKQKGDSQFLSNDVENMTHEIEGASTESSLEKDEIRQFIFDSQTTIDIDALEAYVMQSRQNLEHSQEPIAIDLAPMLCSKKGGQSRASQMRNQMEKEQEEIKQNQMIQQQVQQNYSGASQATQQQTSAQDEISLKDLQSNHDLSALVNSSKLIYTSSQQNVNDQTSEYVVQTIKYFFESFIVVQFPLDEIGSPKIKLPQAPVLISVQHQIIIIIIVVQYSITNTLEDQVLSEVKLQIQNLESQNGLQIQKVANLPKDQSIKYGEKKFVYAVLSKQGSNHPFPLAKIQQKLSLRITEIDIDSKDELGSYEEDYNIDEVVIAVRDYVKPFALPQGQFKDAWDALGSDPNIAEITQTFQIPFKSMEEAVSGAIKFFGMGVCDGSDKVNVTEKVHRIYLGGLFMNSEMTMVACQIGFNQEYGCVLKMQVRSLNSIISNIVLEAVNS